MSEARRRAIIQGLSFAPDLMPVFQGGLHFRLDEKLPARKYFLAHAGREIILHLDDYVAVLNHDSGERDRRKVDRAVLRDVAPQWVAQISPLLATFLDQRPGLEIPTVTVPVQPLSDLEALMQHEARAEQRQRDKRRTGFIPLAPYVPSERLNEISDRLQAMYRTFVRNAHIPDPGRTANETEVVSLWDELEDHLHTLIGSAAWQYFALDAQIVEFDSL
jgi:hypothetical protein